MAKSRTRKKVDAKKQLEEPVEELEHRSAQEKNGGANGEERVSMRDAGFGLIALGSILVLIALFIPFFLEGTDERIISLSAEAFIFAFVGLGAIALGAILVNFRRLSRKL